MYTKIAKVSVNREKTVSSIGKKMWERGQKSSGKPFFDFFPTNPFPIYSQYADLYDRKTFHKSKNQKKMKRTATTFVFSCLAALTAESASIWSTAIQEFLIGILLEGLTTIPFLYIYT